MSRDMTMAPGVGLEPTTYGLTVRFERSRGTVAVSTFLLVTGGVSTFPTITASHTELPDMAVYLIVC
jgi:hypothetical protein